MKAVVYTRYGSPDVLPFTDVQKPTPKDNQVRSSRGVWCRRARSRM